MISKFSMTNISNNLANEQFLAWCSELDTEIYKCLDKAFEGEKISELRKNRIKDNFAMAMLERSNKNKGELK